MIVQLGQRSVDGDIDVLLSECHLRIRHFLSLAHRSATQRAGDDEVKAAAGQVQRYFAVGFPLHLADEDELIIPALTGRDCSVDLALSRMHRDHAEHDERVSHLIKLCASIERQPRCLPELSRGLAASAEQLSRLLEPHMQMEEHDIFPALRLLSSRQRTDIRDAIRARRF